MQMNLFQTAMLGCFSRKHCKDTEGCPRLALCHATGCISAVVYCRWGYVVANHLAFLQYNYVVHDHDDYKLLRRLCNGAGFDKMPTIIISNFSVPQHVIPAAKRLPDAVSSLAGVLRCSNKKCGHIVMNCLIDGVCINHSVASHVVNGRQHPLLRPVWSCS